MHVILSVGSLVASFCDPPASRKFDLDLGLKDQPKDVQDRHYKVMTVSAVDFQNVPGVEDGVAVLFGGFSVWPHCCWQIRQIKERLPFQ